MHGAAGRGMTDWAACTTATWTSFRNLRTHLFRNHVLVVNLMRLRDRMCRDVDKVVFVDHSVFHHLLQIGIGADSGDEHHPARTICIPSAMSTSIPLLEGATPRKSLQSRSHVCEPAGRAMKPKRKVCYLSLNAYGLPCRI